MSRELLRRLPPFDGLSDAELDRIRAAGETTGGEAAEDVVLLRLIGENPAAARDALRALAARLRDVEAMLRQGEKMAALGTLTAGLAHDLNNPAAAVKRSSAQLRETLAELQRLAAELGGLGLSPQAAERMNALRRDLPRRAADPVKLDPMARSDLESEVGSWMEDRGVEAPWELAPAIVALGWGPASLEELTAPFTQAQRPAFLTWLATGCTAYALLDEIGQGAERISEIVTAVKSTARQDQAPAQQVDVHEGLDNTLMILRHKLRDGVTVVKEYAAGLPRIEAYAGELNQVWTNLIDNAADAMNGRGVLRIRTASLGDRVVVEITDSGPGIPPEAQALIFDAFFTTKPAGTGTGLGLHVTYDIIVHRHRGEIAVESQPGRTTFRVTLPVRAIARPAAS